MGVSNSRILEEYIPGSSFKSIEDKDLEKIAKSVGKIIIGKTVLLDFF